MSTIFQTYVQRFKHFNVLCVVFLPPFSPFPGGRSFLLRLHLSRGSRAFRGGREAPGKVRLAGQLVVTAPGDRCGHPLRGEVVPCDSDNQLAITGQNLWKPKSLQKFQELNFTGSKWIKSCVHDGLLLDRSDRSLPTRSVTGALAGRVAVSLLFRDGKF